jgi:4-hydroxymandelate oxidase
MTDPLDFEARAAERLPERIRAYFATGAGSQATIGEAAAAWSAIRFRPRLLTDVSTTTVSTTTLGSPVLTPVLIAPMAQRLAAHAEGEIAMGLAAASSGSLLGVSTHTAVRFADIAATRCLWWFQVYLMRERGLTELLVRRAIEHGARALVLTADMVALLPSTVNPRDWPEGPAKARHANLTADELRAAGTRGLQTDPSIGVDAIGWLHAISGLPVLVKGVLRADDARRCVDAGAAGLVVSTHGGRRMGASISSAAALPEVVAAVPDSVEIYVDSGIRSAEHVAAALAMGARAVFVGRPALWALAAEGRAGVERLLGNWSADLRLVMTQLGIADLSGFGPDLIS